MTSQPSSIPPIAGSNSEQEEKPLYGPEQRPSRTPPTVKQSHRHLGKPERKQFALFQIGPRVFESLLFEVWTPFYLTSFPIVDFAAFVVSWSASSFLTVNLSQAQAFAAPPYSYTAQKIGFFNIAVVVGQILGLLTAGPLIDWICMRATNRNNGIREPEMRLPAMIPYTMIMILGNLVVGLGYQYYWDWRVRYFAFFLTPL